MPRENRKRGKKHKKQVEQVVEQEPEVTAGPSWIVPRASQQPEVNTEAPFGYVDADVKAYFRTVDLQIREWQEYASIAPDNLENDPNEDRRLFLIAALKEMSGKERQLATDPDCSSILERMAYSMDDFTRRVFMDRLAGSYEQLTRHRFASHVCQTMFLVASETVSRETRGTLPTVPDSQDLGELRTVTRLVLDACEELLPSVPSLVMDPFASHVIRALLTLLSPHLFPAAHSSSVIRSKKSAAWKSHQGPMKSVFATDVQRVDQQHFTLKKLPEFMNMARRFVDKLRDNMDANEIRALAANQFASPVLQMLLEVEADHDIADEPGSLMDQVLVGLIALQKRDPSSTPEPSDYVMALLRDPTSSHLLEGLISRASESVFDILWSTYFVGKLSRLATHPVANFVVAKALYRTDERQLPEAYMELRNSWQKIIQSSRVGVLRAAVDRTAALHFQEADAVEVLYSIFELVTDDDRLLLVPCILRLMSLSEYKAGLVEDAHGKPAGKVGSKKHSEDGAFEPKTQGTLLLQSMLCLSSPHNECVVRSVKSMNKRELLELAQHPTSSRVLDGILDSPTIITKAKHELIMSFLGEYHDLVDDRIGSRVGDRCLLVADPYVKEKIARSLLPYEHTLVGSQYGRYFARNLNLVLFKRDLSTWKRMQASRSSGQNAERFNKDHASSQASSRSGAVETEQKSTKRKRKQKAGDDIDELFDSALGKKKVRHALDHEDDHNVDEPNNVAPKQIGVDEGLRDILGAIRRAPKEDEGRRKKRH